MSVCCNKGSATFSPTVSDASSADVARVAPHADAVRAEVDVLGVVLAFEPRRQQAHDMHLRAAAIACELAHLRAVAHILGKPLDQLADDVAHPVRLLLARDMACDAAGILNLLEAVEHLEHGGRLGSVRIPHVHREDQRGAARIVLEDRLGRRIGENPTVPVKFAIDAHRRKRGRQRAGGENMRDVDLAIAAVEVAHHATAHMRGADGQPRRAAVDQRKVDQLVQSLAQRRGIVA